MTTLEVNDAKALLEAACDETGLSDYGDNSFVEPLTSYLTSVLREAGLGPVGREFLQADTIRLLSNRLRLEADFKAHPEIGDEDVSDPIVIAGLPRTGTTKLQRSIAADPGVHSLPFWLGMSPGRIAAAAGEQDPRIAIGEAYSAGLEQMGPDFLAAHKMSTHLAEEDTLLLQLTFDRCSALCWYYDAPTYYADMLGRSQVAAYRYLKKTLQNLQWQRGGRQGRPWVLKSPAHLDNLDAILTVFPNATVVHCHRAVDIAMPSLCRLIETIRPAKGVVDVDPARIGEFFTAMLSKAWQDNLAQRAQFPAARILDVMYDDIDQDLPGSIRTVYETHGLDFSADREQLFRTWEQEHPAPPRGKGGHAYDLETYKLTRGGLTAAFETYLERFPFARPQV